MLQLKNNGILTILTVSAFLFSCEKKTEQSSISPAKVKTKIIHYDNLSTQQEYIGTVESENTLEVSFLVLGTVEYMYLNEGQRVSKGQLLASLNTSSLKSAHNLTLASLRQAEDAYRRLSTMYKSESLPEIKLIEIKTQLEQAKANEAIARKNLNDGNLYAPQSGVISRRLVEPGSNVIPGSAVYQIMDISSIKVKAAIPENEISKINRGTSCNVKIAALNDESFQGTVIEKGVSANPISHTYDVKIKIDNSSGKIMPGMVSKVYLNSSGNNEKHIVVPLKSIQVDHTGKRFVWVRSKENKAQYKAVIMGKLYGNNVEIVYGLNEGTEIITEGYQNISNGAQVITKNKD
ncbi:MULTISPECIES: efflux RND transporter periplasmic adaptor subunit [unclassified Chryseobacterium]|uniref:efflux RND transporter periplasmic adaptor subunit n=1 Tax=unclassified Chryseobacterium TaxID=2593645 RepID=UPI00301027AE